MNCNHEEFESEVKVGRLNEVENGPIKDYIVELKVRCKNCKKNLEFRGEMGMSFGRPMVSADRYELRAPAEYTDKTSITNQN